MIDEQDLFERAAGHFDPPVDALDRMVGQRERRRRNRQLGTIALVAALGVIVVLVAVRLGGFADRTQPAIRPIPPPTNASVPKVDFTIDLDTGTTKPLPAAILETPETGSYAVSPDGSMLAFVGLAADGSTQIFVANIDGTGIRQVTQDSLGASDPSWSPEGSQLVYVASGQGAGNRALFVVDVASGVAEQITFEVLNPGSPSFSPDGSTILFDTRIGDTSEIRTVPAAGGRLTTILRSKWWSFGQPSYSPDGQRIAFVGAQVGSHIPRVTGIWLANADGGYPHALFSETGRHDPPRWSPDGTRIAYARDAGPYEPGCPCQVVLLDVAAKSRSLVSPGEHPTWLDTSTLIVEH